MVLAQNIGNLCGFKENQQKWLTIAEFRGQNYKAFPGEDTPDSPNVNFLVQRDGVRDFTPEKVGNTE